MKGNLRVLKPLAGTLQRVVTVTAHPFQSDSPSQIRPSVFNKGCKQTGKPEQKQGRQKDQQGRKNQHWAAAEGEEEEGEGGGLRQAPSPLPRPRLVCPLHRLAGRLRPSAPSSTPSLLKLAPLAPAPEDATSAASWAPDQT